MIKSLFQNIKYLLLSSSLATGFIYGCCYYRAQKNKRQYLQAIKSDTLKDASRLSNDSFGISWGFQADDTVMNSIDSGDIFFIKYKCIECLDPIQMMKCYKLTIPLLDEEYHAVGVAFRDETGLMSYFNQFGQNKLMRYSQFVSLPYIKELMVQKTSHNIHDKLLKLLYEDKAFNQIQDYHSPNDPNKLLEQISGQKKQLKQQLKQLVAPKQQTLTFINRVLRKITFLSENQEDITDVRELFRNEKQVNIRTQTNKTLRSL